MGSVIRHSFLRSIRIVESAIVFSVTAERAMTVWLASSFRDVVSCWFGY